MKRAKIAQPFLNPDSIIEDLAIFEYGLASCFPCGIEPPMYNLLFQNRKEALAPCIVTRSADSGKLCLQPYEATRVMTSADVYWPAAITVKNDVRRQVPAILSSF